MNEQRPLIIVPYRDRPTHLSCLLLHMGKHFHDLTIVVVEQSDITVFNKGLLFNIGYKVLSPYYDYVILHDVDFVPVAGKVDYGYCDTPTLLSTECSQFDYGHCYDKFFGGVVGLTKEHYELVNGFSNLFRGWGGEDDLFYNSFVQKGITPTKRMGNRFENFAHPRLDNRPQIGKDFYNPDYQNNLRLCQSPRDYSDGLSTLEQFCRGYEIVAQEPKYIHIKVETNS